VIDKDKLKAGLRAREGDRARPYKDTRGHLTIGVGHNLDAKGLSPAAREFVLNEDVSDAIAFLQARLPWALELDDARARVFVELAFNMGERLLEFHDTLAAAQARDFGRAAACLGASLWARQVDDGIGGRIGRADVLCAMLRSGKDPL
jgi:lysozyme